MKRTLVVAATITAAVVGLAGCGSSGGSKASSDSGNSASSPAAQKSGPDTSAKGTLTVWLQVDAKKNWPQAVKAATQAFQQKYPNVKVNVQYQQWSNHLNKFEASAKSHSEPDVIEFGNTETTKYIVDGALADLTSVKSTFANSDQWIKGLSDSCTLNGKTYCVPYYAGDRAVGYNKDMFKAAGITSTPKTWTELMSDVKKIAKQHKSDQGFDAFYMPGKYYYAGLSFIKDAGGDFAVQKNGKWQAELESKASQKGLQNWLDLINAGYTGDRTKDELDQHKVMAAKKAAMMYGAAWDNANIYSGATSNPKLKGHIGVFAMPSPTHPGQTLPTFLGGSVLAVTNASQHKDWSEEWIRQFTNDKSEKTFMKTGNLPNASNLTAIVEKQPGEAPYATSLTNSFGTPLAKNWAATEQQNIIKNMLVAIATGKQSIPAATKAADKQMDATLNGS